MRFAIIEDGTVINVISATAAPDLPANRTAVEVTGVKCGPGWIYDDGSETFEDPNRPPDPTPEEVEARIRARIAAVRYQHEVSGITFSGALIDTDRGSQALISGAVLAAQDDPNGPDIRWKSRSGWIVLNPSDVIDMGRAVRAHVQLCFNREKELLDELDAGTFEETMLETGWPGSGSGS